MKLSKVQQETLDKMDIGQDYTAYDLQCSMATLQALRKKKLVTITYENNGAFTFPRTNIDWQKVDKEND